MSALTIFNFENTPVQTIVENNEIFFRATQLAELLQYKNPHDALRKHVDSDDLAKREIVNTINKRAQVLFVNESGMYSLVLSSKLEQAKKVKRWITSEVLPAIRKTGKYQLQPQQLELSETKGKKQRGLLPPKNPFGYMTYEREFTARELEWLVLSWYQAYEYRELLKQLFPMLEAAQSALLTPIKNRIASSDMDFKLSADVLFRITRGTDVMRLAPLITLENYVQ